METIKTEETPTRGRRPKQTEAEKLWIINFIQNEIAPLFEEARVRREMTQTAFAEQLGINQVTYSNEIVRGKYDMTFLRAAKLFKKAGIKITLLVEKKEINLKKKIEIKI